MDLGFVIDGSGSIEHYGRGNFRRCLNFVKIMIRKFKISRSYTRIGIILYSSRPRQVIGFNRNRGKFNVLRVVNRIRYPKGGTRTGLALGYAQKMFRYSGRRKKVLIVMTDGKSHDRVYAPALRLRRKGVQLFTLGIGRKFNYGQLKQMASSPRHVYSAGFRNLASVVRVIKQKACISSKCP